MHILPEHKNLTNQELINIYGPSITQRMVDKKTSVFFLQPSLTKEGGNWHESVEVEKKLGIYDGRKIPKEFVYKFTSKKIKKKNRKAIDKTIFYDRIKLSIKDIVCSKKTRKERLKCLNRVQYAETKTQIS